MVDERESASDSDATTFAGGGARELAEVAAASSLRPGDEVGRYVLLRPLAHGGMGIVYLAFDPELDRNVALKLLLPRRLDRPDERDALVGEARALARLSHPNVIQVYDVGVWGEQVYVALEYLAGATLIEWRRVRPRAWSELLELLVAAGRGIAAAHAAGIVHCDIKPSNILVGEDDAPRVLDFGLARGVAPAPVDASPLVTSSGERHAGRVVGTIGYIAPEQFLGEAPDARSDQFGFCVTAWEALLGVRPFPGRRRRDYEHAVLAGAAPISAPSRVPARVLRVLRRGLARNPADRWRDLPELLSELEGARVGWVRRPWVLAAAAGVIAVGGLGLRALQGDGAPSCRHGAEQIEPTWNDTRRARASAAFDASGAPFARYAWASVAAMLASRAEAWGSVHDEVCAATHVRREQSQAALDRALGCLRERRSELEALVALFERADGEVVEHAAAATRALGKADECRAPEHGDVEGLDEPARARAQALAERLAQVRAWVGAHDERAAFEGARELAALAEADGLHAMRAQAAVLAARAAADDGRTPEALAWLDTAVVAAEIAGDDRTRAEALVRLVEIAGRLDEQREHAHWYARTADEVLTRIGGHGRLRAELRASEAMVWADEGEHDRALAAFRDALTLRDELGLGLDESLAVIRAGLGDLHSARGEPEHALGSFVQAHAMRLALDGVGHPELARAERAVIEALRALR